MVILYIFLSAVKLFWFYRNKGAADRVKMLYQAGTYIVLLPYFNTCHTLEHNNKKKITQFEIYSSVHVNAVDNDNTD